MVHANRESAPKEAALDTGLGPIKRFGRYTLVKKLATGGMAEIWLARQTGVAGFNRFVVIKKILSHLAEEETFRNMFLDEARMSAALTHPNIVQVYDLGEADETYFIAMEFILGENLAAIAWRGVKRTSALSPTFAARIMADACKALDYAHRLRGPNGVPMEIVHRDISPQNILVTYEGEVKVVDFGIAKAASKSQHTKTGMLKGKFSYMSPEQCLGNNVDKRSDVFALGIVLYELCTGKRLFKHESELMILEMITKRRITPPSEVADNIPADLERIIMKALEKDISTRYASAQDLQIALEDFIRNQNEPATNADIAAYMRSLFQDKIEEKRRLCELASREDFGVPASFGDEEQTERAQPRHSIPGSSNGGQRRIVYGQGPLSTGQIHVNGVVRNGAQTGQMPGQFGSMPPMMVNGRMTNPQLSGVVGMQFPNGALVNGQFTGQQLNSLQQYTGQAPAITDERSSWVPRLIIIFALLVILVAGAYLYNEILAPKPPPEVASVQPQLPVKVGQIAVDSVPSGAVISVDDTQVKLEDGQPARTPIMQLTNLQYGKQYRIKLEKEGYEVHLETVTMGAELDGRSYKPHLKPILGRIVVEVTGPDARDVTVYFNDQRIGMGTQELRWRPEVVRISATLANQECRASPEEIMVPPGGATRATVRCSARVARSVSSGGGGGAVVRRDIPPRQEMVPKTGPADCQPMGNDVPAGFATIDTSPFSEIFWDGKRLGETPLSKQKFPSGCVELVAKSKDPPIEKKVRIKVEPNRVQRYRFDLK